MVTVGAVEIGRACPCAASATPPRGHLFTLPVRHSVLQQQVWLVRSAPCTWAPAPVPALHHAKSENHLGLPSSGTSPDPQRVMRLRVSLSLFGRCSLRPFLQCFLLLPSFVFRFSCACASLV
jgi:hypothetical protein